MPIEQRVAIVTGAGGSLGQVIARTLLEAGACVVLASVGPETMEQTMQVSKSSGRAVGVVADLAQEEGRRLLVDKALEAFGHVDILINNAAITSISIWPDYARNPPKLWEIDPALFARLFQVNMLAPHFLAGLVLPGMIERGWGRIVNVTCNFDTMHNRIPYGSTKAALESYSAGLAANVAGTGVTVNVLVPGGMVATARGVPPGATTVPADIVASPILWLASEDSNHSNGLRYDAKKWDGSSAPIEAAAKAGAPIGWVHFSSAAAPRPSPT